MSQATAIVPADGIRPGYNETGTDLAAKIFLKLTAGTRRDSVAIAQDGESVHGVSMAAIVDTEYGDVQTQGVAVVTAGAAVARGAEVTANNSGQVITAVSGDYIAGIARTSSGASGEDIEVELVGSSSGRIKA